MTILARGRRSGTWLALIVALVLVPEAVADHASDVPSPAWRPLFNGRDLDGWAVVMQDAPAGEDPTGVVTIRDGLIHGYRAQAHGSKVPMGYIGTRERFENYHLKLEYRWGRKQFEPRFLLKPDAGVYYHHDAPDAIWPQALQFQVELHDTGDLLTVGAIQVDTTIDPATRRDDWHQFLPADEGGVPHSAGGKGVSYTRRRANAERDGWNRIDLICKGDEAVHLVNGRLVNRAHAIRRQDAANPNQMVPLTSGRILLEFEATEVFYRAIEVRPLAQDETIDRAIRLATEENERPADASLKVGAASVELEADDAMVIGGGIGPGRATGQEAPLRVVAVVLEKTGAGRAAIVACDVLMMNRDLLDPVVEEIARVCDIPSQAILINSTHTHHAPTTCTVHGYERDPVFCSRVQRGIVEAVTKASSRLRDDGASTFRFALGEEASVGQNSRLLLGDGTIFWTGRRDDVVRPTGPFDPELPVLAFDRPDGGLKAMIFNHSTHTIGTIRPGARSPSFYGLAAQGLERQHGGTALFLEGASGSTHNLDLKCEEMVVRIQGAVNDALSKATPRAVDRIDAIRRPFLFSVRSFNEEAEEQAVTSYCAARLPAGSVEPIAKVFRDMRAELAPRQGQKRVSWLQVMRIGDVAIVGVPAEFFTVLGRDIKKKSPFRYTYIAELANDWIGYLPDRRGHELGGYQTWTGLHSYAAPGTGEALVDQAVAMLQELHDR
jgi:hypothetical protein